jgi:hypothetical protein|tara:strand:+ start:291 stop:1526 length:1236 start_codon:yes stop_codon:yes gene_type:complete
MAIKFGMTIADMIRQLTRGFRSVAGRDPDGLEKIKIQQEAVQRFKDMNKVVDMQGQTLDPSKTIMGGTQEGAALRSGIMKATGAKPKPVKEGGLERVAKTLEANQKRKLNTFKNLDNNKKLTDDEYQEFLDEIGGEDRLEAYEFDGTAGSAKKILKEDVEYEQSMFNQYKKEKLNDPIKRAFEREKKEGKFENIRLKDGRKIESEDDFRDYIDELNEDSNFATGGRAGFKIGGIDKARRAFLKTIGAAGAGIGAAKTGILSLGEKAAPMVQAAKETVTQAPSYFFDLVAKIKTLGKPGISLGPRQNTMNYKNYELMEDVSTGDLRITKQKGDPEFGYEEEVMEYRKGQRTEDGVIPDEYEEATIRPDGDGKMKDFEDGIEPDSIQEIIDEATKQAPPIKKAGGGIAVMLGE